LHPVGLGEQDLMDHRVLLGGLSVVCRGGYSELWPSVVQISNAVSCSAKKGAVAWEETGGLAVGLGTTVVGDGKGDVVPKGDDGWMECG